ncbi:TWiK family of potassium channels protein 7 [Daktulosphaira vitifoliae]|uniref:TWiK family of potassium channels protein 7 n=1 Tax=Daktulosphaira vitifoliae TaxID=58002 RepID=UPI0021AA93FF|nr:TWiK family of potassium channels protein 7 [Daktulosphaira vitifoliae]
MERKRSGRRYYNRRKKTWTQQCKDYLRQFIAFLFSNIGIICLVVGYTIAGAFMFIFIEGTSSNAKAIIDRVSANRSGTVARLWDLTCCTEYCEETWRKEVQTHLRAFQSHVIEAVRNSYEGANKEMTRWSFSGSFLYSLSVITTIGYGNVTPRTLLGKLATILYAIVGMPLFLLYLSNIGDILAKSFKWIYAKCCLCRGCKKRRKRMLALQRKEQWKMDMRDFKLNIGVLTEGEESDDEGTTDESSSLSFNDTQEVTVPISLCLTIMVGYISGGAVLFAKWEDWEFFDGSYFCFISLSTIGFGDFVPGSNITGPGTGSGPIQGVELSFILCSMYLMLGMALIAMCFNLMQQDVVMKIRTCTDILRRITRCKN